MWIWSWENLLRIWVYIEANLSTVWDSVLVSLLRIWDNRALVCDLSFCKVFVYLRGVLARRWWWAGPWRGWRTAGWWSGWREMSFGSGKECRVARRTRAGRTAPAADLWGWSMRRLQSTSAQQHPQRCVWVWL